MLTEECILASGDLSVGRSQSRERVTVILPTPAGAEKQPHLHVSRCRNATPPPAAAAAPSTPPQSFTKQPPAPESRLNIRAVQLFALLAVMGSDRKINKENTGPTVTENTTHICGNRPRLIGQLVFGL